MWKSGSSGHFDLAQDQHQNVLSHAVFQINAQFPCILAWSMAQVVCARRVNCSHRPSPSEQQFSFRRLPPSHHPSNKLPCSVLPNPRQESIAAIQLPPNLDQDIAVDAIQRHQQLKFKVQTCHHLLAGLGHFLVHHPCLVLNRKSLHRKAGSFLHIGVENIRSRPSTRHRNCLRKW